MVSSRTATALAGLVLSVAISVAAWYVFDTFLLFLFVPFVPFLLRRSATGQPPPRTRECPTCGFETAAAEVKYCPRDGSRLE